MSRLHFFYGVMSAGKSVQLIQTHYNLTQNGTPVVAVKPCTDTRSAENEISSRIGISCPAAPMRSINANKIISQFPDTKVLLVDEVQFFNASSIKNLVLLADKYDITVMCYGLKINCDGIMWPAAKKLIEEGATLHELRTSCQMPDCQKLASHILLYLDGKVAKRPVQPVIGDTAFKSVCRKHFYEKYHGK